ncbi:MAG: SLBB domain-containing protein [Armatimonadetes bacterium]|nr:SLBB domain-containing protein [Armatimonadota bacterium]MDE2205564.1 SLBB domain-containing protein [Armatimonadota bacterium]
MKRFLISVGLVLAAASAGAQTKPAAAPSPTITIPPAIEQPTVGPYQLGGGDVISINVINFPNLNVSQLTIPPDGRISVSLLKPFSVLGKTASEVAQSLTDQWSKYVINPSVNVALVQQRPRSVLIYGCITRPGTLDYKGPMRVLQAIATAGGPTPDGNLADTVISRAAGGKQSINLDHPGEKQGTTADVWLFPGDVVYIPERNTEFSVIGEVTNPGSYPFKEGMTVLDALTRVGGVKETANLKSARVIHDGTSQPLDLEALLLRGDTTANVRLAAGDQLMIPAGNRTYVFGAVLHPGYYTYRPGDRVLDALNGAGGPTTNADMKKLNLIRVNRETNKAHLVPLNLEKFLQKGDLKNNAELQPNDVVYVPFQKRTFRPADLLGVLTGLSFFTGPLHL